MSDQQYINQLQDEYHVAIRLPGVMERWDSISRKLDTLKSELNTPKAIVKSASDFEMDELFKTLNAINNG